MIYHNVYNGTRSGFSIFTLKKVEALKAPFVPFHSLDLGVQSALLVRKYVSCLVDPGSTRHYIAYAVSFMLDTFWARGLS